MTNNSSVCAKESSSTSSDAARDIGGIDSSMLGLASRIDSLIESYSGDATGAVPPPTEILGVPQTGSPSRFDESPDSFAANNDIGFSRTQLVPSALRRATIVLIAGEEVTAQEAESQLYEAGYKKIVSTTIASQAVELMLREKPDVLLLDAGRPEPWGLEILRIKQANVTLAQIPTIVLTASHDSAIKRQALELGATDFLAKPIDSNDLLARVRNALVIKKLYDQISSELTRFEQIMRRRTTELERSRQQLILSLARAAEHRDNETGNHVIRVGRFAGLIARALGWSENRIEMLEQSAQLHDVGKVGVPDSILFKPGKLEPGEFDIIKKHCAWGRGIIEPYSNCEFQTLKSHARLGEAILHIRSSPMLIMASRIAQTHHENWDGSGYPLGLAGTDIPIEGRITAVADVYDALSSKRPYKDPFPREKCFEILRELRGKKFDPEVLDAFFSQAKNITEIQLELMDEESIRP